MNKSNGTQRVYLLHQLPNRLTFPVQAAESPFRETPAENFLFYFIKWIHCGEGNIIKKWGKITGQNMLINPNSEKLSPQTYNKRLSDY